MKLRPIVAVARHDLLDLRRQRGVWFGLLLIPFVTVSFLLLLPGVLSQREQASQARATYRVGVQLDADVAAPAVFAALDLPDRLRPTTSTDARKDVVAGTSDVGLRLEGDPTDRLAGGQPVSGAVFVLSSRSSSRAAFGALAQALEETSLRLTDERLAERDLAPSAARPVVVRQVDLSDTARGRRLSLASLLPLLVLLPAAGTVGVSAQRISGSKDQRVFEPLLLLPHSRVELLAGKALSSWTIGTISLAAVGLPLLLGRAIPVGAGGRTVSLPFDEVVAVVAIGTVLLTLLIAVGTAVGAASRTSAELGSVLQMATLPIFLMGSFLQFRSGIVTQPALLVVPFFGVLLCIRDVAIDALQPAHLALAIAATAAWSTLAMSIAARIVQSEKSVVRSST